MENDIAIGMYLGNRKYAVCALDRAGKVLFRTEVPNTPEALKAFFRQQPGRDGAKTDASGRQSNSNVSSWSWG